MADQSLYHLSESDSRQISFNWASLYGWLPLLTRKQQKSPSNITQEKTKNCKYFNNHSLFVCIQNVRQSDWLNFSWMLCNFAGKIFAKTSSVVLLKILLNLIIFTAWSLMKFCPLTRIKLSQHILLILIHKEKGFHLVPAAYLQLEIFSKIAGPHERGMILPVKYFLPEGELGKNFTPVKNLLTMFWLAL